MSAIKDYTDRVNAKFDLIQTGLGELANAVANIAGDVTWLKSVIEKLQNNPGPISPEDQALLDALETRIGTVLDNVTGTAASAKALADSTTPPEVPPS